jgi:hypothetical protein
VPRRKADEIFDLVAKFAGYGFNKSHAAAYALIAYQTAYLKANHPVEFLAASMAACSAKARPTSCRSDAASSPAWTLAERMAQEKEASASISPPTRSTATATSPRRTARRASPSSAACRRRRTAGARRAVMAGLVEEARWRTSAKGRRYLMATLSDASGQFVATVFDDGRAQVEEAAKAGGCGLLNVELDRRPGEEAPRVTIKRIQSFEACPSAPACAPDHAAARPCRARAWQRARSSRAGRTAAHHPHRLAGVARDARKLAKALERLGIKRGDRVATLAMNHAATSSAGTARSAWAASSTPSTRACSPTSSSTSPTMPRTGCSSTTGLRAARREDEAAAGRRSSITSASTTASFEALIAPRRRLSLGRGRRARAVRLCYTSGTTGNPKGVLYEHRSTVLHAMAEVSPTCSTSRARSVVLPIVPMFHANAWGVPWAAPMAGCQAGLLRRLSPAADVRPVPRGGRHPLGRRADRLAGHDRAYRAHRRELGSLKSVTIGGSAAPRAMIEWFRAGRPVGHAWGMTEMSPIGTCGAPPANWDDMTDEEQIDFICRKQGRVPFGVELRIVDDEGKELPRDGKSSGRLQVRGPWIVERYFKDESSRRRPTPTAGSTPATSPSSTPTARCRSPTAPRT